MNIWTSIAMAALAAFLVGCDRPQTSAPATKAAAKAAEKEDTHAGEDVVKVPPEELKQAGVRVEPLAATSLQDRFEVTAAVHANEDRFAHVAPRVPGRLARVHAKLGDHVKEGQTLAVLDSVEVGESHAAYLQSLSEANVSRTAYERAARLFKEEVIPAKEYQRIRADYEKAQAAMRAAADRLRLLGTSPKGEVGQSAVSTYPLTSPNSGTVVEKHAVLGELAKPDTSLFTIADLSVVWVEADVAEKDLARIRVGASAEVTVAAYPSERFKGRVTYVGGVLDKATRTARSRIEVPNPGGRLLPGMFATASIQSGATTSVLAVPDAAVTLIQGVPTVFVEEAAGFEARSVELGERSGGQVVVKSGLKAGELVVVEGVYALKARKLKSQIGEGHAH